MDILRYTTIIIGGLVVNYVLVFGVALWALFAGKLLPIDFLEMVFASMQFLILFKTFHEFSSSIKEVNLSSIKKSFNSWYVISGFGVGLFAITWFDVGIFMDIFNRGLHEKVYLQIYNMGYTVLLGVFLGNMFSELISYLSYVVQEEARIQASQNRDTRDT